MSCPTATTGSCPPPLVDFNSGLPTCAQHGQYKQGTAGIFPMCSTAKGAGSGPWVMCPGAQTAEWVDDINQLPGQTAFVGRGVCVDPASGAPLTAPGCPRPTECSYQLKGKPPSEPTVRPDGTLAAQYKCDEDSTKAQCVEATRFRCDATTGACVSTRISPGPGETTLEDCLSSCRPPKRYRCDPTSKTCVETTDNSGSPLPDCLQLPDCQRFRCNPATHACEPTDGTSGTDKGTCLQQPDCQKYACVDGQCKATTDGTGVLLDACKALPACQSVVYKCNETRGVCETVPAGTPGGTDDLATCQAQVACAPRYACDNSAGKCVALDPGSDKWSSATIDKAACDRGCATGTGTAPAGGIGTGGWIGIIVAIIVAVVVGVLLVIGVAYALFVRARTPKTTAP